MSIVQDISIQADEILILPATVLGLIRIDELKAASNRFLSVPVIGLTRYEAAILEGSFALCPSDPAFPYLLSFSVQAIIKDEQPSS